MLSIFIMTVEKVFLIYVIMWLFNHISFEQRTKDIVNGVVMVLLIIAYLISSGR